MDKKQIGLLGQRAAVYFLKKRGYEILYENVHAGHGELDIVAFCNQELVFIEVKTRTSRAHGNPEDAVTQRKQAHLSQSIMRFVAQHDELSYTGIRFDIIAVVLAKNKRVAQVKHFQDVLLAP